MGNKQYGESIHVYRERERVSALCMGSDLWLHIYEGAHVPENMHEAAVMYYSHPTCVKSAA